MSLSPTTAGGRVVPFVMQLRTRPGIETVGGEGGERRAVRVQLSEQWDTVSFDVRTDVPVATLKRAALAQFGRAAEPPDAYVLKLLGVDVSDETVTLAASGARDGSTFLLTRRRRRAVR